MQIHELPIGVPGIDDVIPIDNGVSTRKTPFSQFEAGGNPVTFESDDSASPTAWKSADILESGTIGDLLVTLSKMVSNLRWINNRFLNPVSIPANANINNYTDPGNYFTATKEVAETITNTPFTETSYQMLVFSYATQQRFQVAWRNNIASPIKYRVRNYLGEWGDWIQLAKESEIENIGDYVDSESLSSSKSVASGTATNITSINIPAGRWVVVGQVTFSSVSGKGGTYRRAMIGNTSGGSNYANSQVPALESNNTVINIAATVHTSTAQTLYLGCQQGSGQSATVTTGCFIKAMRIK